MTATPITSTSFPILYLHDALPFYVIGSRRAVKVADLSPELAGIVDEISFKSGEDIKAGAVLVKLRAADDVARLDALRASAELAQSIYSRDKAQMEAHAISQAALDSRDRKSTRLNSSH